MRHTLSLIILLLGPTALTANDSLYQFTTADIEFLKQFRLDAWPKPPHSPGNRWADDDKAAVFGKSLFYDTRLSRNQRVSCGHCHQPGRYFTDGLDVSKGLATTSRSAPSLIGLAFSPWLYWDGRKDSLWAQALAPIEHPDEQGFSRAEVAKLIESNYRSEYESVFGEISSGTIDWSATDLPASPDGDPRAKQHWQQLNDDQRDYINRVFVNVGKAIMAYERKIQLSKAPFDHFIDALVARDTARAKETLQPSQVRGLRLFMGKANCASCHNGMLFTNHEFHNIGAPESNPAEVDLGRYSGVKRLRDDEFTCLSEYSDANVHECKEMRFLKIQGPELVGAIKTPTLRNVAATAPYMQAGQFLTLQQVLEHYNKPAPPFYDRKQHPSRPHFDIVPLNFAPEDLEDIEAFLHSLTSPIPNDDPWWPNP